jgi:hypothetical protein
MTRRSRSQISYSAAAAALSWFALALQFHLSIRMSIANGGSVLHGVWMYFAFFTILTNLLVAVALSVPLAAPESRAGRFFSAPETVAGVAVNIALVGVAYNLLLRHLWNPQGLQLLGDVLLHDVVPLVFVAYAWLLGADAGARFAARVRWAAWPAAYFAYVLARGAASGFYPYPFLNVTNLGLSRVLFNALGILAGYLLLAAVLALLERARPRLPAAG